jgi:hypothetical protein
MTTLASPHLRNRVHREIGELLDQPAGARAVLRAVASSAADEP